MPISRIILYAHDAEATVRFYETHFGFRASHAAGDRIVELIPEGGGASLMIHPASKGQKCGQSLVKLVFDVRDVVAFCDRSAVAGLVFGSIHHADGYQFANVKDPSGNPISVSSRAFRNA
ncbi:VOC family protein [Ensifer sp.]|uniref:VOC family protein n=1 Tax=Ensifer sp. TaxID=1872086 RepID=UPI002E116EC4|nr:VOC family protein [Ensifer sp.]